MSGAPKDKFDDEALDSCAMNIMCCDEMEKQDQQNQSKARRASPPFLSNNSPFRHMM
jgi:hypothetical protein